MSPRPSAGRRSRRRPAFRLDPAGAPPYRAAMALQDFLRLFWFRGPERDAPTPVPRWRAPTRVHVGMRVLLRIPIASAHTTWIPAGATGVVVGGDPKARQVSIELDTDRKSVV